eukprot:CAMPEP_0182437916 /NCGR_PEP_ID=MMETSP1167-20130531/85370_1 /TAXON_ID=2988 /ORGANISM="Mallomonas Sp, Strain CCMP3275" /LENGTH=252 /DNA_ID=CAMNT_0024631007 /DNA_START=1048 /DNA_END=1806 /DNA_ORIENTATION=-
MKQCKIAVLIDGDNAESGLIPEYVAEAGRFGKVTVKRIYADWTEPQMKSWKSHLNSYAIRPIQKFAYTKAKSSTDTALIIDAMDLLHSKLVDGFCIVSSDSDYTGLAHRIREEGYFIMGIGRSHTPEAFVKACESFTFSEILIPTSENIIESSIDTKTKSQSTNPTNKKSKIDIQMVRRAFDIAADMDNGYALLSRLSETLRSQDPTFDARSYGFSSFSKFCEALSPDFVIVKEGTIHYLREKSVDKSMTDK